jgi:hypothetical protein
MSKVTSGKNNPMYGRSIYDVWLEKFGKEIADQKYKSWREHCTNKSKKERANNI